MYAWFLQYFKTKSGAWNEKLIKVKTCVILDLRQCDIVNII